MAKDYEVNPRQVKNTPTSLPQTDVYSQFSNAMGGIANFAGEMAVSSAVEQAAIQGAKERSEGKKREKLAPGITKATASFNDAYRKMDSNIIFAERKNLLDATKNQILDPSTYDPKTAAQAYSEAAKKIISEGLKGSLPENKPELAFDLMKHAANAELQIDDYSRNYIYTKGKIIADKTADAILKDATNFAQANSDEFHDAAARYKEQVQSQVATNFITQAEADAKLEAAQDEIIKAYYKGRGERDAIAGTGVIEARAREMAKGIEGYTPQQQDEAMQAYLAGAAVRQSMMSAQQTVNAGETTLGIISNQVTTEEQIDEKDLTASQATAAKIQLYRYQHAVDKKTQNVAKFLNNVQTGGGVQNLKASEETKEAAWDILKQAYLNRKIELTGNPDEFLTPVDEAEILKQINTPIPSVDERIKYSLKSANIDTELPGIEWAMAMLRTVGAEKANAIGIDDKSRAIGNLANVSTQYGRIPPRQAIEGARAIVNADEPTLRGRATRQSTGEFMKEMHDAYVETTGADSTVNPTSWGAWQSIYRAQAMLTDSTKAAKESARQVMTPAFGESNFFMPGEYGYLPPEKVVPLGDQGNWLSNQITLKLIDIAEANKNAPLDQISNLSKIELGGDPKQAKRLIEAAKTNKLSQQNLFDMKIAPFQKNQYGDVEVPLTYRIAGTDRPIYLEADSASRLGDGNKVSYSVYTINPFDGLKEPVQDPRSRGFARITIDPLDQMLPDVYAARNNVLFRKATENVTAEEYKQKTNIFLRNYGGQFVYHIRHGKEALAQLKKNEKQYEDNGVVMSNSGGTLLSKIDVLEELRKPKDE